VRVSERDDDAVEGIAVEPWPRTEIQNVPRRWPRARLGKGGREIYFRNGDAMMMAPVSPNGSSLVLGKPEPLFTGRFVTATNPSGDRWYDVTPDGQRFLMLKADEQHQLIRVQNFQEELKLLTDTSRR
jgi:hypothetical protein